MLVVIGSIVVLGSVIGGFVMVGGHLGVLIQPSEFVVIGGAAIGSFLISTPSAVLKRILAGMKGFFSSGASKSDYLDLLSMLYQLFKVAQQSGVMALEGHFDNPANSSILSQYPKFLARHHAVDFLSDSVKV